MQFKNKCFAEMCGGSEAGSYLRLKYHSTLGLRVITKKKDVFRVQLSPMDPDTPCLGCR